MQQIIDKATFLVGNAQILECMKMTAVRNLFDERVVDFLNDLSRELLKNPACKVFPDVISYAFWIRKSNIIKQKERFQTRPAKMGKGIAFHITPSNVPVNFAVSMTSAILAGNPSVLRVSNKKFPQVDLITESMNGLLSEKYQDLQEMFCVLRYDYDDEMSTYLSEMCDIRIIWGGDGTIQEMRRFPLQPRGTELTFADRHSLAVINSDEYMKQDAERVADLFFTDTYYTDQNACSSPRLIVWMGSQIEEAKEKFWRHLKEKVKEEYKFSSVMAVDKYEKFCELATDIAMQKIKPKIVSCDNICVRVKVSQLTSELMSYKMYGGYFFEYEAKALEELIPVLTKSCQTVAYLGIEVEKIYDVVKKSGVRGVDRIVPVGHTMDLSFYWDGNDMIDSMSRYVDVHGNVSGL